MEMIETKKRNYGKIWLRIKDGLQWQGEKLEGKIRGEIKRSGGGWGRRENLQNPVDRGELGEQRETRKDKRYEYIGQSIIIHAISSEIFNRTRASNASSPSIEEILKIWHL